MKKINTVHKSLPGGQFQYLPICTLYHKFCFFRFNFVLCIFFTFHFSLFFTLLSTPIHAQNVTLQGFITDGSSGQVLPGANVILFEAGQEEVFRGTATDQNGFYSIGGIQPGRYDVRISFLGYVTHEEALDLGDERRITLSKALLPDIEHLDDLVVSVRGGATNQTVGHQRIRPGDLSRAPTPAGTGDLVSYLQIQPGVVTAGDRGGHLFIRGTFLGEDQPLKFENHYLNLRRGAIFTN